MKMLIGFLLGLVAGLIVYMTAPDAPWVESVTTYVTGPIGQIFLRLLFMLVIPLLFSALVVGIAEMGEIRVAEARRPEDAGLHGRRLVDRGADRARRGQPAAAGRRGRSRRGAEALLAEQAASAAEHRRARPRAADGHRRGRRHHPQQHRRRDGQQQTILAVMFFALFFGIGLLLVRHARHRALKSGSRACSKWRCG